MWMILSQVRITMFLIHVHDIQLFRGFRTKNCIISKRNNFLGREHDIKNHLSSYQYYTIPILLKSNSAQKFPKLPKKERLQ